VPFAGGVVVVVGGVVNVGDGEGDGASGPQATMANTAKNTTTSTAPVKNHRLILALLWSLESGQAGKE
jgi:hypothetical protein